MSGNEPAPARPAYADGVPTAKAGLRARMAAGDFVTALELVPWRGPEAIGGGKASLATARELAADPRIAAISITDNPGGHPMVSPVGLGEELLGLGQDVIVHVAGRDRSRNGLLSLAWELERKGIRNVLCVSGDYPTEGFEGLSRPVFDLDAVGLLALFRGLGADRAGPASGTGPAVGGDPAAGPAFCLGTAVSPFKRTEAETMLQYLKLGLKVRAGADFVITQVGFDSRKWDELLRWMRRSGLDRPVLANVYVMTAGMARRFHAGGIPGCVVSDDLLARIEREAAAPDKGRGFFLDLAARQLAIARGLGFRGAYLGGSLGAADVDRILETAAAYGQDDWQGLAREVAWSPAGTFRLFAQDRTTGLNTDELEPGYAASITPKGRARLRRRTSAWYRLNRTVHGALFDPESLGFRAAGTVYRGVERLHVERPLHVLEQAVKVPCYDCRDCGDCSLPDVAYLCPESQCPKGERNGPCGGSHDGVCEVRPQPCVWVRAYDRLKPFGEELAMLDRPPVLNDNRLRRTSAWANTFLRRDHFAKRAAAAAAPEAPSGS